ncbi:MAG TPA: choline/ethanolamine kinase family protein [Dermatophilaceae bacterium]|nr:choline/ethanolamine kinase family protein [Dermatophilaceae bacterium]
MTELPGGLTNHNYRVRTASADVVVRVSPPGTDLLAVDREVEHHNSVAAAAAGVGAPVIDYLPGRGVLVVGFLTARTYSEDDVAANLPRIAAALRRLHAGPPFVGRLDMFALQRRYLALAHERGMRMPSGYDSLAPVVARAEAALAAYPEPLVPCHNDLLAANFLDDGQDVRIIDYEYSGLNEPAFELGNIAQESGLSDAALVGLVEAYYPRADARLLARARTWRAISGYGWTLWGVIQHHVSGIDADFWGWATHKYDTAATLLRDSAFVDTLSVAAAAPAPTPRAPA